MGEVLGVILGGGKGTRLYPLTKYRSKPAVPLAGTHRLIDIPISNCLNSDISRIFVLTQFNSASLNRHVSLTYHFDFFRREGFVNILAAEQTRESNDWFQGTADAIRKTLRHYKRYNFKYYMILSGDHIYRMDYREMIREHKANGADMSMAALPVKKSKAPELGVIKIDSEGWIKEFVEKPKDPKVIDELEIEEKFWEDHDLLPRPGYCLSNMGVYCFNRDVLEDILENGEEEDFGKEIFPKALDEGRKVYTHLFNDYWEDIGTIQSFYEANLNFVDVVPKFSFYDEEKPIYTHARFLPPSKISQATAFRAILSQGCIVDDAFIRRSIIGIRGIVGRGSTIINTIVMGADDYETIDEKLSNEKHGIPNIGIGRDCHIEGVIIDKNARIGNRVRIVAGNAPNQNGNGWMLVDGIVIVEKNAVLPDDTQIVFR